MFFRKNANFALSTFAFAVEGWIFYSAVNSVVPQIVLNLGFETNSWRISIRQLGYTMLTMFASIPITWYATRFKDMKTPLLVTFGLFLIVYVSLPWSNTAEDPTDNSCPVPSVTPASHPPGTAHRWVST